MKTSIIIFIIIILMQVLLSSCASTTPPTIFLPEQDSHLLPFYQNGIPIAAVNADSSFMMISMEFAEVSNTKYLRLWLLYKNISSTPFLLEPLKDAKMVITKGKDTFEQITPQSPTQMLADIENEKATSQILQAIGGTLKAMATQPTKITNKNGEEWKINDRPEKVERENDKTTANMSSTASLYDDFKNSVNSGILRRNTIFPGESVNGYIYFPLPSIHTSYGEKDINTSHYNYRLYISTPYGKSVIQFTPAAGE